jgi:hypothetical protein
MFGLLISFSPIHLVNSDETQTDTDKELKTEQKQTIINNSANQKGLKVYIDPDTGEKIDPPKNEAELIQPNNSIINNDQQGDQEELVEIIHPDGSATIVMPESFQHSNKVKIDKNGTKVTECVREYEHK